MNLLLKFWKLVFGLSVLGSRLLMEPLGLFKTNKDGPKTEEPAGFAPAPAKIVIDVNKTEGKIDPLIYGSFIEVLGRCIYGGIWDENNKKVPLIHGGLRRDVLEEINALKVSIMRWPGGCFADTYHWQDGIGPRELRKVKKNRAWHSWGPKLGPMHDNHFGSDEFMLFVRELNTEPYININFGSGTPEEAAHWVEYMNGAVSTEFGALRAKNGHPEPYNVKVWGIANEIWGNHEIGYCSTAENYAHRYVEFAQAMRAVDPSIKLVAVGTDFTMPQWNRPLMTIAGEYIDYLSLHVYIPGKFLATLSNSVKSFYNIIAGAFEIERRIEWVEKSIDESIGTKKKIGITLDEWGPWWNARQLYEGYYTLRDGLFAASVFEILHRHSNTVQMANYAQIVNVLPMIFTNSTDLYHNPIYLAFQIFSNYAEPYIVSSSVTGDTRLNPKYGIISETMIPYLGCSVTTNQAKNKLVIIGINRHHAHNLSTTINLAHFEPEPTAQIFELNGPSHSAYNFFNKKDEVTIHEKAFTSVASQFTYQFPAHSVTALILQKKE